MAKITAEELKTLSKYIYSIAGIYLDQSKGYLVESRLNPLLVAFDLANFSELYYQAKTDASGELEKHIIDAISTNETFFFRDSTPFEQLKYKIIPELIDRREQKQGRGEKIPISIWSAACSTGQEVYSMAISLLEVLPRIDRYEITILGSDISQQAISQASYGKYNKLEVGRGLPPEYLQKYFQPVAGGWRIKDSIRSMASFKVMNLMHPFGAIGPFDIVFCRNVAIYFSYPDKKKLFSRIARVMRPGGYLIVGGSETLSGIAPQFQSRHYLRGMYYQLQSGPQAVQAKQQAHTSPAPALSQPEPPKKRPQAKPDRQQPKPAAKASRQQAGPKAKPQSEKPAPNPAEKAEPTPAKDAGPPKPVRRSQTKPASGSSLLNSLRSQPRRTGEKKPQDGVEKKTSTGSLLSRLQDKKKSRSS